MVLDHLWSGGRVRDLPFFLSYCCAYLSLFHELLLAWLCHCHCFVGAVLYPAGIAHLLNEKEAINLSPLYALTSDLFLFVLLAVPHARQQIILDNELMIQRRADMQQHEQR
jgi:hypothetical protein